MIGVALTLLPSTCLGADFRPGPALGSLQTISDGGADAASLSRGYDGAGARGSAAAAQWNFRTLPNLTGSWPELSDRLAPKPKNKPPEIARASEKKPLRTKTWMGIGFLGAALAIAGFATVWPLGVVGLVAAGTSLYKLYKDPGTIVKIVYPDGSSEPLGR